MSPSHRRLVRLAAIALSAAGPASGALAARASAATLTPDKACYVNVNPAAGAPMTITGSGFTPGDELALSGTGVFADATADPSGNVAFSTPAPILSTTDPAQKTTALTVTDETAGGTVGTLRVRSANLSVTTRPASVKNVRRDKVTFLFSGFTPGKHIYGFYMRHKIVAKVKFRKASGPCGMLRQRALLYPGGRPHNDTYKVAFESQRRYSKKASPIFSGKLSILRF